MRPSICEGQLDPKMVTLGLFLLAKLGFLRLDIIWALHSVGG